MEAKPEINLDGCVFVCMCVCVCVCGGGGLNQSSAGA